MSGLPLTICKLSKLLQKFKSDCLVVSFPLKTALSLGEMLFEQKRSMRHGEFTDWIEENMPFTPRTARNYMKVYKNRNLVEFSGSLNVSAAYDLLKNLYTAA